MMYHTMSSLGAFRPAALPHAQAMRYPAIALPSAHRLALASLLMAVMTGAATARAQEARSIPAFMLDVRGGLGSEHSNAPFRDDLAAIGLFGVAVRVARRVAVDLSVSGIGLAGGRDKVNAIQYVNPPTQLPYFSARGATAGLLVGLGPVRQPERTTIALGAGVFSAGDADVPLGSRSKVLGFNAGIEESFEFLSHYGVTVGLHPLVLLNLRGGTWGMLPVSVGVRLF